MNIRKRILFLINGEVVVEESKDLFPNEVDEMKWVIASECECNFDDIEVKLETLYNEQELSDYNVTSIGIVHFKDTQFKTIEGVKCTGDIDDLLDYISKKYIGNYLELS